MNLLDDIRNNLGTLENSINKMIEGQIEFTILLQKAAEQLLKEQNKCS